MNGPFGSSYKVPRKAHFDCDEMAVVLGAVRRRVGEGLDDRHDEFLDGVVEGVAAESIDIGDGFECLHGISPFVGIKKPATWRVAYLNSTVFPDRPVRMDNGDGSMSVAC